MHQVVWMKTSCHPIASSPRPDGQITAWISPFSSHVSLNVSLDSVISGRLKEYLDCSTISRIYALWLCSKLWKSLMNTYLYHDFPAPCCFWVFVWLMNPFGVAEATAAEQLISRCDWYISLNRNPCSGSHFNLSGNVHFLCTDICMCVVLNSKAVCQSFSKDETCLFFVFPLALFNLYWLCGVKHMALLVIILEN